MKFFKKIKLTIENIIIKVADKLIDRREWKKYNPEHLDLLDYLETLGFVIKLENALIAKRDNIKAYRRYIFYKKVREELGLEFDRPFELIKHKFKDIA